MHKVVSLKAENHQFDYRDSPGLDTVRQEAPNKLPEKENDQEEEVGGEDREQGDNLAEGMREGRRWLGWWLSRLGGSLPRNLPRAHHPPHYVHLAGPNHPPRWG